MPVVLISPERMHQKPGPHVDLLQNAGFEVRYPKNPHLARGLVGDDETIRELQDADATLASTENYNRRVLESLPRLRVIARTVVGYDRIDVAAATERRVAVAITPNANHEAVAELALGLLFSISKSLVFNDRQVRAGHWPRQVLMPVRGRTLGIFGLGRIGRSLAVRALPLGMRVIATENLPDEAFVRQHSIELVAFEELLARSDYLSIHAPLTSETRHLFNQDALAQMRPGSVLINTSRGELVVESDLHRALTSGPLRAAGLDVFEREPPASDNPLLQLDNVILSPHMAGADETSAVAMGVEAADCIVRLSRNQWPVGSIVNDQLRDDWRWEL